MIINTAGIRSFLLKHIRIQDVGGGDEVHESAGNDQAVGLGSTREEADPFQYGFRGGHDRCYRSGAEYEIICWRKVVLGVDVIQPYAHLDQAFSVLIIFWLPYSLHFSAKKFNCSSRNDTFGARRCP